MKAVGLILNGLILILGFAALFFFIGANLQFLRIDVGLASVWHNTIFSSICAILLAGAAICLDKANKALAQGSKRS
ncbi:hypothetical protein [Rhizobium jaguaris]|uniref:Uncharacterized protein n=1 Tax=Rhizobium jaguaris TaxID=1312183 RepID=A0A387G9P7_9HYPH|nr:hypothetical protein [Rhizobium jaguaris]AYG64531.1 hypothetical protein CCGE525_38130 [Rhizobium jaguaris]